MQRGQPNDLMAFLLIRFGRAERKFFRHDNCSSREKPVSGAQVFGNQTLIEVGQEPFGATAVGLELVAEVII